MARTQKKMMAHHLILGFCLWINLSIFATPNRIDFLVVKDPNTLNLLNEFEQPITDDDKRVLSPNCPFEIIQASGTLGDQITPVLKTHVLGHQFLVLQEHNRSFPASKEQKIYKGSVKQNDTIVIQKNNAIPFINNTDPEGNAEWLDENEPVIRIFEFGKTTFVARIKNPTIQFGWALSLTRESFKPFTKPRFSQHTNAITESDLSGVKRILTEANGRYHALFGFMDRKFNADKAIPSWTLISDGQTLRCTLNGASDSVAHALSGSSQILSQTLEGVFIGKRIETSFKPREISIRLRPEN